MATDLSAVFSALGHPTRLALVRRLVKGEASVTELAEPFGVSLMAVSKHLKYLERAGLITRHRRAQQRMCRLNPAPLAQVAGWVEAYRDFWDERFDALEALLTPQHKDES